MTLIKHTQGSNAENDDEHDSSQPNKTHQKVNNPINPVNELQTMDGNVTMENAYEEGDVSLNRPTDSQSAQERRHGQEPPDLSGYFPGTIRGQQQGQHPPAVEGQVQGNASG